MDCLSDYHNSFFLDSYTPQVELIFTLNGILVCVFMYVCLWWMEIWHSWTYVYIWLFLIACMLVNWHMIHIMDRLTNKQTASKGTALSIKTWMRISTMSKKAGGCMPVHSVLWLKSMGWTERIY